VVTVRWKRKQADGGAVLVSGAQLAPIDAGQSAHPIAAIGRFPREIA